MLRRLAIPKNPAYTANSCMFNISLSSAHGCGQELYLLVILAHLKLLIRTDTRSVKAISNRVWRRQTRVENGTRGSVFKRTRMSDFQTLCSLHIRALLLEYLEHCCSNTSSTAARTSRALLLERYRYRHSSLSYTVIRTVSSAAIRLCYKVQFHFLIELDSIKKYSTTL